MSDEKKNEPEATHSSRETIDLSKGFSHKSAEGVDFTPSSDYVAPTMSMNATPADSGDSPTE
jgi:hypothetical protein